MGNLITSLGASTFNDRVRSSYFLDKDGDAGCIVHLTDHRKPKPDSDGDYYYKVQYRKIIGDLDSTAARAVTSEEEVDFFKNFGVLEVPSLGWRSYYSGRGLAYLSRNNRSYHRGISRSNLFVEKSPMTEWLERNTSWKHTMDDNMLCLITCKPKYLGMQEGLAKIRQGEILSFAASPTVAVSPATARTLDVWFRKTKVGTINADDTLDTTPSFRSYVESL